MCQNEWKQLILQVFSPRTHVTYISGTKPYMFCRTYMMELYLSLSLWSFIGHLWWTCFQWKSSITDVQLGSKYASGHCKDIPFWKNLSIPALWNLWILWRKGQMKCSSLSNEHLGHSPLLEKRFGQRLNPGQESSLSNALMRNSDTILSQIPCWNTYVLVFKWARHASETQKKPHSYWNGIA